MAALAVLIGVAFCWVGLPFAMKRWQVLLLRRRCKAGRLIVLTYDDGPSVQLTGTILEVLGSSRVGATFFLVGRKLDQLPEMARRIVNAGHEVGSHSYRHLNAWKRDPVNVFLDIGRGLRAIRSMTECRLFRAPYGKPTLASLIQARLQGCRQAWWTIDSTDTWDNHKSVDEIIGTVRRDGGGVVLMHDMDRPDQIEVQEFVIELTKRLIALAETEEFRICKLGEVIGE